MTDAWGLLSIAVLSDACMNCYPSPLAGINLAKHLYVFESLPDVTTKALYESQSPVGDLPDDPWEYL